MGLMLWPVRTLNMGSVESGRGTSRLPAMERSSRESPAMELWWTSWMLRENAGTAGGPPRTAPFEWGSFRHSRGFGLQPRNRGVHPEIGVCTPKSWSAPHHWGLPTLQRGLNAVIGV